jgi:hypothetical protein
MLTLLRGQGSWQRDMVSIMGTRLDKGRALEGQDCRGRTSILRDRQEKVLDLGCTRTQDIYATGYQ